MNRQHLVGRTLAVGLASLVAWGSVAGASPASTAFRHDGTATVPVDLDPSWRPEVAWRTALPTWGNASPVVLGDRVCVTAEPTTVTCLDGATGAVRWSTSVDYVHTLPEAEREAFAARLAKKDALEARMTALRREVGQARRDLRRRDAEGDPAARLAEAVASLDAVRGELDGLLPYLTPADKDIIGYASATPVVHDGSLFVQFGHGVVGRLEADGTRSWAVWLGPPKRPMRGFDFGSSTAPQVVDGTLVVGHGHLRGLDPATGAVRWVGPAWRDYGAPAVVRLDGATALVTPDGTAVDAADGTILAEDLGDVWYTSPVADGTTVHFVGGFGHESEPDNTRVRAVTLSQGSAGLEVLVRHERPLPDGERVYGVPVIHDGRLYHLTRTSHLRVLEAATGQTLQDLDLGPALLGFTAFASPLILGDDLIAVGEGGSLARVDVSGPEARLRHTWTVGEVARGVPAVGHGHLYHRTAGGLIAWELAAPSP